MRCARVIVLSLTLTAASALAVNQPLSSAPGEDSGIDLQPFESYDYTFSGRDPFVSPLVVPVLVGESVTKIKNAIEALNMAVSSFEKGLSSVTDIQAISYGMSGGDAAVVNNKVVRPGQLIPMPINEEVNSLLTQVVRAASDAGFRAQIYGSEDEGTLLFRMHRVSRRGIHIKVEGLDNEIVIGFERNMNPVKKDDEN